ncbi:MAG: hypothetical protein PHX82_04925 [Paracoccaceae bacterium]|nr:hypothetical protein [Paracoccaceae bacterium]
MIGFEHYVSGSEIGGKLQQDAEELAYALIELFNDPPERLAKDLRDYLGIDWDTIVLNLRQLADQIEAAE